MLDYFLRKVYRGLRARLRSLCQETGAIARSGYCGLYLNWTLPPRRWNTMSKVHWNYSKLLWRKNKLFAIATSLAWPFIAIVFALKKTLKFGAAVKKKTGMTLAHQLADQVWLATRYYIPSRAYYYYGLYDPLNRKQASLYVQDHEIVPLLEMINKDADHELLDDKLAFFVQCKRLGLRTIPIVAQSSGGKISLFNGNHLLSADLLAKPQKGKCGQGVNLYTYEAPGRYRTGDGRSLTAKELLEQLAEYAPQKPYILQPRVRNHPAIAGFSQDALCTSRIITCIDPLGAVRIVASIFKMAAGGTCTDNFATGGIAIPIDSQTGILGTGITKERFIERIMVHPDTGRQFTGFRIPHWDQVITLCRRAHKAFPAYAFIGWDIAVDHQGPIIVEGNLQWGVESMQMAHQSPLGHPVFGLQYMAHVGNKPIVN